MSPLTALAALCACALAAPAMAGPAVEDSGVRGRVIDVTCYGPCAVGTNPRPFAGEADVVVTIPGSGEEVARTAVEKSRYLVGLEPGLYRIRAIPFPKQESPCWHGQPRRVRVEPGEVKRRRLTVENVCVQ